MRLSKTESGHDLFTYDTVADMVQFCDSRKYVSQFEGFAGKKLPTWKSVEEAVNVPDPRALKILRDMVDRLLAEPLPEIKSHMRKLRYNDFDGDELDYDRLRAGQEYWRKAVREEASGPTEVTIVTDISANATINATDVYWRGAAAIALTTILEAAGYRVELWVIEGTSPCYGEKRKILSAGCLKKTHETLDASGIVNAISSWFYRSVDFTIVKTQAAYLNRKIEGVGGAYTPTQSDLDALTPDVLRIYTAGVFSFKGSFEMVKAELERVTSKKGN